jgi:hypothetical protein
MRRPISSTPAPDGVLAVVEIADVDADGESGGSHARGVTAVSVLGMEHREAAGAGRFHPRRVTPAR